MFKNVSFFSLCIAILFFNSMLFGQVVVQLRQPPPNQLRAADIWKVTITNTGRIPLKVILNGTLSKSNDGVIVDGKSKLLTIPSGVKTITYDDVKNGSVNFKSGVWREAFTRTGNAPSGDYTICIKLTNEAGEQIANECIDQNVTITSALVLMNPSDRDVLLPQVQPSFSWTTLNSTPGSVYKIKIVEIIGNQSPEQALKINRALFEKSDLRSAMFQYPITAPKFQANKRYAWQVSELRNGNVESTSEVRSFSQSSGGVAKSLPGAGGGGGNNPPANPTNPPSNCQSPANTVVLTNQIASTKTAAAFVGQTIKVGNFTMKVLTASGTSTALTGTGSILINWLKTPIAVKFTSIKVNTVDEFYSGEIISEFDQSPETYPVQWAQNTAGSFNWTTTQVKSLNKWLHGLVSGYPAINKLAKDFDLNQMALDYTDVPLKLPIGVNDAEGYTIAISEMKFEPTIAKLNCVAIFPVDEYNDSVGFKGSGIIFSNGGPSLNSAKLGLIDDITFTGNVPNGDSYSVVFKKEQGADAGTFIDWDCEGFRELNIDLDVLFPRSWLKPIPDNGTSKAKLNIKTNIVKWDDWIVEANLPNSTIAGTQNMQLQVTSFYYDHSIVRNPDSLSFPANYPTGATTGVDFKGFYIKTAKIKLPDNFKTSSQNVFVNVDKMIINKNGITGKILAKNVFTFPNGNISGLGASVDTVKLELICSSITNAYIRGKIVLPFSEEITGNYLPYKALFNSDSGFHFTVSPQAPITAKMFSDAKFTLDNTSIIRLSANNGFDFDIKLDGEFGWDNVNIGPVKNVKMAMEFQDLGMKYSNNDFTFEKGTWSFASPPKWLANFPVSIKNVKFGMKPKQGIEVIRGGLSFSIIVNLDDKIGGSSALTVLGAIEKNTAGKYIPKYVGVQVDTIKIFANLSAVKLDGKIAFFNGDPMFGNGFDGTIKATINSIKSEISTTLKMGSTNYNNNGVYFRYWYVDAKVVLPKTYGIPFMSGLAFYGFGAGVWKGMTVSNVPPLNLSAIENATGQTATTPSGATFVPNKNIGLGLKVLAVIGTYPEPKAFNSDASLSGQFSTSGGLNKIEFNFDFWCLTELTKRSEATILGNANVQYVPPTKVFSLSASVFINRPPITTVGIGNVNDRVNLALNINGKTSKWYFICGTPAQTNKVKVLSANAWEYILVGNDIGQFVKTGFQPSTITGLNSVNISLTPTPTKVPTQSASGKGFSFGVGVNFQNEKSFVLTSLPRGDVKLVYGAGGGFEVNLSLLQYSQSTVCGTNSPIGLKGWYAQGGVAAWFRGYVKVTVPKKNSNICTICCGTSGTCDYPFIDIKTGFYAQAGFPNPVWVIGQGAVSVNVAGIVNWSGTVNLDYNTPCTPTVPPDNQVYAEEDATQQIGDMIINIDTPPSTERFDPAQRIGTMLGFTPNEVFDVQERQSDGIILNRTYQVKYTAVLTPMGPAPFVQNSNNYATNLTITNISLASQGGGNISQVTNTPNTGGGLGTTLNLGTLQVSNPFTLLRSNAPNNIGQYGYYIQRPIASSFRNLEDTTKYKFTLTADLWTIRAGTVSLWEKAKSKTGSFITEIKTVIFKTGILQPQVLTFNNNSNNASYQNRVNNNITPISNGGGR